jgi:uncharacterized protein YbaP (TraB family)
MKKIFVLTILVLASVSAFAQKPAKASNTGLLFEITGKGLTKPSYIFGTFHVICESDMLPLDRLNELIAASGQTIMEIDMDDPAELQALIGAGSQTSNGKSLSDYLSPAKYKKVDGVVREYLGVSVDTMKTMKPSLIGIRILTSPKATGCTKLSGYDLAILQASIRGQKPIVGLETVEFQSKALEAKPIAKQAEDLYKSASNPPKYINELKTMMEIYKQQDVDKISEFAAKQMKKDKQVGEVLIDDRNRSWIPKIEAAIAGKPAFIAVGAAHLGGKNGVLELLRKNGYTVTPIRL